jgi:2,3-bisphosphoglycerate-independent phosphoglycerate mutase
MARVLLLFVDGVGLGPNDPSSNPFLRARLPCLQQLMGGMPLVHGTAPAHADRASLAAVDATLGHDGTPQSGTGQAALLTGADAVALHGRHFGPWVPARLQRLVREESVLARAAAAGWRVAFANAYPEEVLDLVADGAGGRPAPPLPSDAPARANRARRARAVVPACRTPTGGTGRGCPEPAHGGPGTWRRRRERDNERRLAPHAWPDIGAGHRRRGCRQ